MTVTPKPPLQPSSHRHERWPAGHVIVVVVVALLLGLLVNAEDIRRTAQRQEQGWVRTTTLALAEPIYAISHALRLDRPRAAIDELLGRAEAAEPEVAQPPPAPATPVIPTTAVPGLPERRQVSVDDPLVMYIGGDSMVGQFGPMLQNRLGESGLVESEVVYEFESGLSRPDFIDWPERLRRVGEELDPDVVVLYFGGNDGQAIYVDENTWIDLGTPEWEAEYRRRVDEVMTLLVEQGRWVYWMGLPVVESDTFQPRIDLMNRVYEEVAADHPMVTFFPAEPIFTGPDGGYAEFLPNSDGEVVDMRLDDGVHYTTAGAIYLVDHLYPMIADDWALPPE